MHWETRPGVRGKTKKNYFQCGQALTVVRKNTFRTQMTTSFERHKMSFALKYSRDHAMVIRYFFRVNVIVLFQKSWDNTCTEYLPIALSEFMVAFASRSVTNNDRKAKNTMLSVNEHKLPLAHNFMNSFTHPVMGHCAQFVPFLYKHCIRGNELTQKGITLS